MTPTFFSHMQAALEEARAHGMWLDYTFGSGWPFGGAGAVTPELASGGIAMARSRAFVVQCIFTRSCRCGG